MDQRRALALYVACNVDRSQRKRIPRDRDAWILNPRVPARLQSDNVVLQAERLGQRWTSCAPRRWPGADLSEAELGLPSGLLHECRPPAPIRTVVSGQRSNVMSSTRFTPNRNGSRSSRGRPRSRPIWSTAVRASRNSSGCRRCWRTSGRRSDLTCTRSSPSSIQSTEPGDHPCPSDDEPRPSASGSAGDARPEAAGDRAHLRCAGAAADGELTHAGAPPRRCGAWRCAGSLVRPAARRRLPRGGPPRSAPPRARSTCASPPGIARCSSASARREAPRG